MSHTTQPRRCAEDPLGLRRDPGSVPAFAFAHLPPRLRPARGPGSTDRPRRYRRSGWAQGLSRDAPYYLGVSQGFTHESNVFRSPNGSSDTYSSTSLLGGFDQPIGRQRLFGTASVSANRYFKQSELDNTSYALNAGLDWETINKLSGNVNASA